MLLDDRVTIATPEGVSLELVLAGVGSRFVARLLDTVIQLAIIIALALGIYVTSAPGIVRAVVRVLIFLVLFGYDVPFEVLNGGRTIGKLAAGHPGRRHASANRSASSPSAIRNILRIVDFLPVVLRRRRHLRSCRPSAINASAISRRERSSCATASPASPAASSAPATVPVEAVATWDVSALDHDDLATIHQFLDRRLAMPIPVRAYFATELAARVAPEGRRRAVRHASRVPARGHRRRQAGAGVMTRCRPRRSRAARRASCASRAAAWSRSRRRGRFSRCTRRSRARSGRSPASRARSAG